MSSCGGLCFYSTAFINPCSINTVEMVRHRRIFFSVVWFHRDSPLTTPTAWAVFQDIKALGARPISEDGAGDAEVPGEC